MNGSENFDRQWQNYVNGFGDLKREHWLGLEKIHCLTASKGRAELYIDMYDCAYVHKKIQSSYFLLSHSYIVHYNHLRIYSIKTVTGMAELRLNSNGT